MNEDSLRMELVRVGKSLFARGYCCGTAGNLSVRIESGGYLMSPTNVSLGDLSVDQLSKFDRDGQHVAGPRPTKEAWLHFAMYRNRLKDNAVVHLHSTYAVAISCLKDRNGEDVIPALTPYVIIKTGRVALVPYFRPGNTTMGETIARVAKDHRALLLANHGPVVSGPDMNSAVSAAEELEETAKLFFILREQPYRSLTNDEVVELESVFGQGKL